MVTVMQNGPCPLQNEGSQVLSIRSRVSLGPELDDQFWVLGSTHNS